MRWQQFEFQRRWSRCVSVKSGETCRTWTHRMQKQHKYTKKKKTYSWQSHEQRSIWAQSSRAAASHQQSGDSSVTCWLQEKKKKAYQDTRHIMQAAASASVMIKCVKLTVIKTEWAKLTFHSVYLNLQMDEYKVIQLYEESKCARTAYRRMV